MVPPCINKFYILDLQPENSLVRYAVEQGHTVFMVSWRNITPEFAHLTWDDYLRLGVMDAIGAALDIMAARGDERVASLTLLSSMLDFSETGEIALFVDEASVAARENAI